MLPAVGVVLLLAIAWGCFRLGVITQRKDDSDARLRLAESLQIARLAHAADTTRLAAEVSRATMAATKARMESIAAETKVVMAQYKVAAARDSMSAAVTALNAAHSPEDSLLAYPVMVKALNGVVLMLTLQVAAEEDVVAKYRREASEEQSRSAVLLKRIATDSILRDQQDRVLGKVLPPPPPSKSRWACVAGATVAMGLRAGAGIGFTCGRTL